MKTSKVLRLLIIVVIILIAGAIIFSDKIASTSSNSGSRSTPSNSSPIRSSPKYKVENVRIEKDHSNAWGVKGMIRNVSSANISGAVKIKFINSKGDIVHSTRAYVNDGDPIKPGQAGPFEYFVAPKVFEDVSKFDVEFY